MPKQAQTASPDDAPCRVDSWAALRTWRLAVHASTLRPRTKLLGLLIADHVNADRGWVAWPSQARLAELSGEARRHVRERITELRADGWLHVPTVGQRGRTARYALIAAPSTLGTELVPTEHGTESVPTGRRVGTDSVSRVGTESVPRVGTDSVPELAPNQCTDVPSTTEGVAREHLKSGPAADLAPADAGPVAALAVMDANGRPFTDAAGRPITPDHPAYSRVARAAAWQGRNSQSEGRAAS